MIEIGLLGGAGSRTFVVERSVSVGLARMRLVQRLQDDRERAPWVAVGEAGTGKQRLAWLWGAARDLPGAVVPIDCRTADPREVVAAAEGIQRNLFDRPFLQEPQRLPGWAQHALALVESRRLFLSFREPPGRLAAAGELERALLCRLGEPYRLPALREEPDEIPIFFEALLRQHSPAPPSLEPSAVEALRRHPWPGNVRELQTVVERTVLGIPLAARTLGPDELAIEAPRRAAAGKSEVDAVQPGGKTLDEIEREVLALVMRQHGGNRKSAALQLGVSRTTLLKKLRDYGLEAAGKG